MTKQYRVQAAFLSFLTLLLKVQLYIADLKRWQRLETFSLRLGLVFEHLRREAVENWLELIVLLDGEIDGVLSNKISVIFGWNGFSLTNQVGWSGQKVSFGWFDIERCWGHWGKSSDEDKNKII